MVRFQDAAWAEDIQKLKVTIVGLGGIGSYLSFFLARCGIQLNIIDYDTVDSTNTSGQLYGKSDNSNYKTDSTLAKLLDYSPYNTSIITYTVEITKDNAIPLLEHSDIIISAVDDMNVRELLFNAYEAILVLNPKSPLFIDGRMAAEQFQCYFVDNLERCELYKKTLFTEEEGEDLPCTNKATSFVGAAIGTVINQWIANKVVNTKNNGLEICSTPYKISYDGFNFRWDITH